VCPRIGGRGDRRPSSPEHRLLQLSGLEDILSSVLDRREIEPGDSLRMVACQSTWQAGQEMNSLLSYADSYSSARAPPCRWGCLPKPVKSNGFLLITFLSQHGRRQPGSIFSAALPVGTPYARIPIDVCRPA
jgi:hypothetical protein